MTPNRRMRTRTRYARTFGALAVAGALVGLVDAVPAGAGAGATSTGRFASLADARDAGVVSGSTLTDLRVGRSTRVIVELGDSVRSRAVTVAAAAGVATQARVAVAPGAPSASAFANPADAPNDATPAAPQIDGNVLRQQLAASKRPVVEAAASLTADRRDYPNLAAFAASVTSESDLLRLANTPGVVRLDPNEPEYQTLASSLPSIGQPAAVAAGFTGAGTYVAIIDSGADLTRSAFGSCSAPGVPANCRVAEMPPDFTTDDTGLNLVSDGAFDDPCGNLHGTNVSGIVAGTAPQTKLVVTDVFEFVDANYNYVPSCTPGSFSIAWTEDILSAVNWLIGRKLAGTNIVAVNLSLGGSTRYTAACTDTHHVAQMLAVGIQPFIAAGNSAVNPQTGFFEDGISSPACISGVVPVGAVNDAGAQASFSQSGPFPNMIWGPGVDIDAAGVLHFSGTSMATPHLAGAFAALSQGLPGSTLASRITLLKDSATLFSNARIARTERRLDMAKMAQFLAPVPNDNRAAASVVGATGSITAGAYLATTEAGEANHGGVAPSRTLWYRHTMTRTGAFQVGSGSRVGLTGGSCVGQTTTYCSRRLAVAGELVEFALSDPPTSTYQHQGVFTEMDAAVDSVASISTSQSVAAPLSFAFDTTTATSTVGDVVAPGASTERTLYFWLPNPGASSVPVTLTVSAAGATPDITVLDGPNPAVARLVARNTKGQTSVGPFLSNALIVISTPSASQGTLSFVTPSLSTPSNDNSGSPIALSGVTGFTTGSTALATPAAPTSFAHDLWYSYTAPSNGLLLFSTVGSNVDTELCATNTATSISDCIGDETALDAGASSVVIRVSTGNVVTIRAGVPVAGVDQGTINLTWLLEPERAAAITVTAPPTTPRIVVVASPVVTPPARGPAPRAAPTP